MRVSAGSFQAGVSSVGEFYLHRLSATPVCDVPAHSRRSVVPTMPNPIRPPEATSAVYEFVLNNLTLSPAHVANLMARGMDEETITRNLYATSPPPGIMSEVLHAAAGVHDLGGIPGICRDADRSWYMAADRGDLLIPVRDANWRIVAIMRRSNRNDRRYKWMSGRGAPSGSPIHNAAPWNAEFRRVIYITEGQLKADVIAATLNFTTIGLPGCGGIPTQLATRLRINYPHVRSVFTAFDADAQTNPNVMQGLQRLESKLRTAGYRVHRVEWDPASGKGLDDVLSRLNAA